MRKIALAFILLSPVCFAQTASTSVAGKWKVHSSVAGNDSDAECTFSQTAADLAGSCTSDQGTSKLTGKVTGASVTWSYSSDYNGTTLTIKFTGNLKDGKISGEMSVDPFGVTGDFTAEPVK